MAKKLEILDHRRVGGRADGGRKRPAESARGPYYHAGKRRIRLRRVLRTALLHR